MRLAKNDKVRDGFLRERFQIFVYVEQRISSIHLMIKEQADTFIEVNREGLLRECRFMSAETKG